MKKEELKLLRRKLGLTQAEMAVQVGKSRKQYNGYENGEPIDKTVQLLAGKIQTTQT